MHNTLLKYFVLLVVIISAIDGIAQEKKERIVIVPFNRFDFQSDHSLQEIASFNKWGSQEEVYTNYRNSLIETLSEGNGEVSLFMLPENEQEYLNRRVPKVYKQEPITHNGVDLEKVIESGRFQSLLENLSADYALFLVQYKIRFKVQAAKQKIDGQKFLSWSLHELTYELYDKEGNLIAVSDGFIMEPHIPTKENYLSKGTSLEELKEEFPKVLEDLSAKIKLYQKKNKPVFEREKYSRSTR